ncbi:hypothetical protein OC835_002799 [Tilletia horrida]|nr:hypothetical protein OC835_002799 [Tilletia horrida]
MAATTAARRAARAVVLALALAVARVAAHPHHHAGPADDTVPIDSILWIHMAVQAFTWLILFPLTMVLGLVRHRLHVPLSAASLLLTTGGYFLGHGHGGRSFPHTAHGTLASLMVFYLAAQTALGVYLKLHLRWSAERYVRPPLLLIHGVLGRLFPVVGWVQCLFGIITLRSWCFGGHLGQCLAHHIMGSAFQAYAVIMLIMMKAAVGWLHRRGHSQEWFDSWVIFVWGLVNAFTEHHGGPWTHKDLQHTLMGVSWIAGGAVGIWLSRGGRRSIFPGLMIFLTGWAMSGHAQALMISTMVHSLFGYVLMAAGVARIIEVCFVLQEGPTGHIPPAPASSRRPRRSTTVSSTLPAASQEGARADDAEEDELEEEVDVFSGDATAEPSLTRGARDSRTGAVRIERNAWFEVKAFQYLSPFLLTAGGVLFMSATDEELRWADAQGVDAVTWGLIDFTIALAFFLWFNVLIDLYVSLGGYKGQAGGVQSSVSASGRLEQGLSRAGGGRRRREYVPLSRRSESGGGVTASLLPNGGQVEEEEGAMLASEAKPKKTGSKQPLRGILANHRSGEGVDEVDGEGQKEMKVSASLGNGHAGSNGHQQHHVLFAESDDEDEDPFDDEQDSNDDGDEDDEPRRRRRQGR